MLNTTDIYQTDKNVINYKLIRLNFPISGRFGRVIVTSKGVDSNILRAEVWRELRVLDEIIQNTTAYYDEETFTYHDICAKWMEQCYTNDILNLDKIITEVI